MQDLQWKYNNNRLRYVSVVGGEAKPAEDDISTESVICNVPESTFVRRVDIIVQELDSVNRGAITVKVGTTSVTVAAGTSIATQDLNLTSTERLPVTVECDNTQGIERIEVTVDYVAFDRVNIKQIKAFEVEA